MLTHRRLTPVLALLFAAGCATHGGFMTYGARRQWVYNHCEDDPFAEDYCSKPAQELLEDPDITSEDKAFANAQLAKPHIMPVPDTLLALIIIGTPFITAQRVRFSGFACKRPSQTEWKCQKSIKPGQTAVVMIGGPNGWQCTTGADHVTCTLDSSALTAIPDDAFVKKLQGYRCDHDSNGKLECAPPPATADDVSR